MALWDKIVQWKRDKMGDESAMKTKVINTVWMKLESEPRRLILQKLKNQFPWRRGSSDPCTPSLLSFNPCSPAQTAGQAERGGERASKLDRDFLCLHTFSLQQCIYLTKKTKPIR